MSTEAQKSNAKIHQIIIQAREEIEIRGVTDVISFDEDSVALDTVCGGMNVDGDALHVRVLDLEQGIVTVNGRIDAVTYCDPVLQKDGKGGLFGRLFR